MAETQASAGHHVYASSLAKAPQPPSHRGGVVAWPLRARNPLWIQTSAKYPAPVRLANKVATVFNGRISSEFGILLDDIQPDVLHTHSMVELPPSVWAQAARRHIPVVHTLHDYDLLCIRAALFKGGHKCEQRHLACRALSAPKQALHNHIDVVAAVSGTVLDTHRQHGLFGHLPVNRTAVIWNPMRAENGPVTRKPRPPGTPLRFGYLGRLVGEKGLGLILKACRLIPAEGWTLQVAGEGPERVSFEAMASSLPVEFLGYVRAAEFLSEIDVLISAPLWNEPFGLTTLEAYNAGCRVIGTSSGVIGEVVEAIEPGWTIAPGDIHALANAMSKALREGSALPDTRRSAASSLLRTLDPKVVSAKYLELYDLARAVKRHPAAKTG